MLRVLGRERVLLPDGVFAPDLAVAAHRGEFSSTLVVEVRSRCGFCLLLGFVDARGLRGVIALVVPLAVALED